MRSHAERGNEGRPWVCALLAILAVLAGCRTPVIEDGGGWAAVLLDHAEDHDTRPLRRGRWIAVDEEASPFRWRFEPGVAAPRNDASDTSKSSEDVATWPPPEWGDPGIAPPKPLHDDPVALRTLTDDDGLVGWNATVLLARRRVTGTDADRSSTERLERTLRRLVEDRPRFDPETGKVAPRTWGERFGIASNAKPGGVPIGHDLHAAAAEAWVHLLADGPGDPVDGLAEVGRLLERRNLEPRLRAALYRAAARWIPPARLPFIEAAFGDLARRTAPLPIRRAAIDCCVVHALAHPEAIDGDDRWPRGIAEAAWDSDDDVRMAYGRWVAVAGRKDAIDVLRRQLADAEQSVRLAAVASLGVLGTEAARAELNELMSGADEGMRGTVAAALVEWGPAAVAPYVDDRSRDLRRAVATALGGIVSEHRDAAVPLLVTLVADGSPAVEEAAIEGVTGWPIRESGPVVLRAMEDGLLETRRIAHDAIRRRLPEESVYDRHALLPERRRAVERIATTLRIDRTPRVQATNDEVDAGAADRRAVLGRWLDALAGRDARTRDRALNELSKSSPADLRLLEELLEGRPASVVRAVVGDVLPKVAPAYESLADLESSDVRRRRRAAADLRNAGAASLTPFLLNRLLEVMRYEQDRIVWARMHEAIRDDGGEAAGRIARLMLDAPWPDLRVLGCDYVARHPRRDRATWLIPLFRDTEAEVVAHAAAAAGRCGHAIAVDGMATDEHPRPLGLVDLLVHRSEDVRIEAAVALAMLDHSEGRRELARLAHSPRPLHRERAYVAMGDTGRASYTGALLAAARAERESRLRRLALGSLERIVDERDRPRMPPADRAPDAALAAWEEFLLGG